MSKTSSNQVIAPSIGAQLRWASQSIAAADAQSDSALLDSKLLLCHCLQCEMVYLHTWPDKTLNESQLIQFRQLVERRQQGHPVAHLVGYRDFWTLRLAVNNTTLIPRPETELLVETALALDLPAQAKVLDLGTGTGAIALALASERPRWHVVGIDKSDAAVQLAMQNAQLNHLQGLHFLQSDWFTHVTQQRFDLIISNPPYVETQSPYLHQGDVRFEPLSALISGEDGLDDIRTIVEQAHHYLTDQGYLMFEHGYQQGEDIRNLFKSNCYSDIKSINDLNTLPRLTMARFCHN